MSSYVIALLSWCTCFYRAVCVRACARDWSATISHIVLNTYMAVGVVVQLRWLVTEGGFGGTSIL